MQMVTLRWGWPGAMPVPADCDVDGLADVAVYDTQQGLWHILASSNGALVTVSWGWAGGLPLHMQMLLDFWFGALP